MDSWHGIAVIDCTDFFSWPFPESDPLSQGPQVARSRSAHSHAHEVHHISVDGSISIFQTGKD